MKLQFKDTIYNFPSSLSEITLRQRIEFHERYGKLLDDSAKVLAEIKDDFDRENEMNVWHLDNAAKNFSFYTGIPLDQVTKEFPIIDLLHIYNTDMQLLFEQERSGELKQVYEWNEETWLLTTPELKPTDKMTLNEFVVSKEVVRSLHGAGNGKWDTLPYLCAIYLRREGEVFQEEFVQDGSNRIQMMLDLPLNIAIAVGFFLSSIVNIYTATSQSFNEEEPRESTPHLTSKSGDG